MVHGRLEWGSGFRQDVASVGELDDLLMTSDDFIVAWGGGPASLQRLDRRLVPGDVHVASVAFLARAGLPREIVYGEGAGPAFLSFARLEHGLVPLSTELPAGVEASPLWSEELIMGAERFEGGASPYWCLHAPSGRVDLVDGEADGPKPEVINSSVAHLAASYLSFRDWMYGAASASRSIAELRDALARSDPAAWPEGRWRVLLEHLGSLPIDEIVFQPVPPPLRRGPGPSGAS